MLDAIALVPRAGFVPPAIVDLAYRDRPLPIPHDQVTTQPSLVAKMVEALALEPSDRVLEIGTGFGWQTALLARLLPGVERRKRCANTPRAPNCGWTRS